MTSTNKQHQYDVLGAESIVIAFLYLLLLVPISHNIYKYLYMKRENRHFNVLVFYGAVVTLIVFQLSAFISMAVLFLKHVNP